MMSKFPGSDHSCRRRYANKLYVGKKNKNKNKNEIYICEAVCDAVREWSVVTRPSTDCQTTFFRRFKQLEKYLKKVVERSRDSGRRSRDRRLTVKQRFLDVSSDLGKFWKKSLNGHATVVGNHATVGRLSNNVFWMFQAIWENFEKSRWTVTRQWSEVTRPSADCQTTFFGRFKQLEIFWKKSLNGHATVVGGHATVGRLSNNVFGRFKRFGKILKKVAERSRDSGWGHATVGRLSNNVFWTFQAIRKFSEESRWTVTQQWSEVTRLSADCRTTFFGPFKRFGKILKKVAERSRDSGWGHATVGRLSNNVFWTFQAIKKFFEKSRWTVTRRWSEVTRPSADCQTTFLDVSSN